MGAGKTNKTASAKSRTRPKICQIPQDVFLLTNTETKGKSLKKSLNIFNGGVSKIQKIE
jgi:hypothetical protein